MAGKHARRCARAHCPRSVSYRRLMQGATLCGPCTTLLQRDQMAKRIENPERKLVLP